MFKVALSGDFWPFFSLIEPIWSPDKQAVLHFFKHKKVGDLVATKMDVDGDPEERLAVVLLPVPHTPIIQLQQQQVSISRITGVKER